MSALLVNESTRFQNACSVLTEMFRPIREGYNLCSCVYVKIDNNFNCIILSDNIDWIKHHLRCEYIVPAPVEIPKHKLTFYHVVRDFRNSPFSQAKHDLINIFNFGDAIDIFNINEDHIELITLGLLPNASNCPAEIYLNNQQSLDHFLHDLRFEIKKHIRNFKHESFVLPEGMRGISSQCFIKGKHAHFYYEGFELLTRREFEVVMNMLKGRTAKEIASIMCLSFRTIEKYIEVIKYKLDCDSKSAVLGKLWRTNLPKRYINSDYGNSKKVINALYDLIHKVK